MLSSLWRTLIHRKFGHSSQENRRGKSPGKRRPRLQVEPLEDRCLLASHIDSFTLDASSVSEGGSVTAFGSFTVDPEPMDAANNYFVRWGDGSTQDGGVSFGPGTFPIGPFTHRYLDDTGPGPTTDFTVMAAVFCCGATVGGDFSSRSVTVNNVPPTLGDVSATTIDENGTTTLSGTISDPGILDTFRLQVNWHDGTTIQTYDFPAGSTSFSVTHQYLDDDPTSTASDDIPIDLTLTDKDGGEATGHTTVTVNNVAPTLTHVMVTSPIDENGTATLTGTITDPGTRDTFRLGINWHDGTTLQTVDLPAGSTSFSVTHQYLDDDPTDTPSDDIPIDLTLTDDDKGEATATTTVTVNNVAPILSNVGVTSPIDENDTATLTGTITDPGTRDTFRLRINWHDGTTLQTVDLPAGANSFTVTHQYLDDNPTGTPSDQFTIDLTLTDDDQGEATATTTITVNNVDPKLTALAATSVDENGVTHLTGTIVDPGTLDTFTLAVVWGDATDVDIVHLGTSHTFDLTHRYLDDDPSRTASDTDSIFVILQDDDFGSDTANIDVTISNVAPKLSDVRVLTLDGDRNFLDEGSRGFLFGDITDPGTLDTFTLVVDWGDGSAVETVAYEAGTTRITLPHTYADDNPSGTASDLYTVHVTLTDDDTGSDTASFQVQVNNVAPTITALTTTTTPEFPHTVDENQMFTLDGTFTDPGKLDTYRLLINWGDRSLPETFDLAAGATEFHIPHKYLDDTPTATPIDDYDISATLIDDDKGVISKSTRIIVFNVSPMLNNVGASASVAENGVAIVFGNIIDPGTLDTFTLEVDWDDGTPRETFTYAAGTTTFLEHHQYLDDNPTGTPQDTRTIGLVLNDDDGGPPDMVLVDCVVRNVAPKLENVQVTSPVDENGNVTLTGDIVDPGTADTFTVQVDWGDGTEVETFENGNRRTFRHTHRYPHGLPGASSGKYSLVVTVTDDDTGQGFAAPEVTVAVGNTSAPHVVEVAVRGSSWGAPAYSIPIGSAAQLRSLPWINLDQVSIRFSENVVIDAGALVLLGVSVPTYAISGFRYDPTTHTATWSLATPLGKDQVLIELGSGMFELGVNVLPGDVNGDGRVTSADARRVRAALRSHHYFVFADVDGNGRVKPADERAVTRRVRRLRLGNGLPSRKRRTIGRVT
jgi:hypothetical protein